MKLTVTDRAKQDLKSVGTFIARDNPVRAQSFVREIRSYIFSLAEFPHKGVAREDVRPGLKMIAFGPYLIFYTVTAGDVRVERVVHSARDRSAVFS